MRKKSASRPPTAVKLEEDFSWPEVIVDFVFDGGVFHIVVENNGTAPAYRVAVKFDREFFGLGGSQEMSGLRLFRCIEFLAPRKRITTLLDTSSAYFQRREPTRLTATVSFRDARRRLHEQRIIHDLSIYKDVSYLLKPAGTNSTVVPNPSSAAAPTTTGGFNYVRIQRSPLQ